MFLFKLKSHRVNEEYKGFHFFILNKGLNSGKPLNEPCPNCFVCICQSEQEKESLYWIAFALWQGQRFKQFLHGSAIPFIRINDLKNCLKSGIESSNRNNKIFYSGLELLQDITRKDQRHKEILKTLTKLKHALVRDILR